MTDSLMAVNIRWMGGRIGGWMEAQTEYNLLLLALPTVSCTLFDSGQNAQITYQCDNHFLTH